MHYTVDAKDETYSAGAYGSIGLERPGMEEICVGWLKEKFGEQHAPTKATGLPW